LFLFQSNFLWNVASGDLQEFEGLARSSKQRSDARPPPTKRLGSVWRQTTTEVPEAPRKSEEVVKEESVLGAYKKFM
jgi:hypothetical protein